MKPQKWKVLWWNRINHKQKAWIKNRLWWIQEKHENTHFTQSLVSHRNSLLFFLLSRSVFFFLCSIEVYKQIVWHSDRYTHKWWNTITNLIEWEINIFFLFSLVTSLNLESLFISLSLSSSSCVCLYYFFDLNRVMNSVLTPRNFTMCVCVDLDFLS